MLNAANQLAFIPNAENYVEKCIESGLAVLSCNLQ